MKCRTCWEEKNDELCMDIMDKFDKLLFCVPRMSETVKGEDKMCNICSKRLDDCFNFITKCIEIEDNLKNLINAKDLQPEKMTEDIKEIKCESPRLPESEALDDLDKHSDNVDNSEDEFKPDNCEDSATEEDIEEKSRKHVELKCSICNKVYYSKERFRKHHFTHTTEEDLRECPVCKLIFNSSQSYEDHINSKHSSDELYKCEKCSKRFLRMCTYKRHKELFQDTKSCRYICERCKKFFFRKVAYEKHMEEIKDAPACDFQQCAVCLVKFTRSDFKDHMKVHKNSIMCEICGKPFASKSLLYSHKIHTHSDPNSFICPHCGRGFKNKRYYTDHLRTHQNLTFEETHKYICDKCPRRFSHKYKLDHHQKQHNNIRDFLCEHCDKSFCTQFAVNQHTRLVHLKVQPYACSFCGKSFGRKDYLKNHLYLHTGEPKLNRKKELVLPRKKLDDSGKVTTLKKRQNDRNDNAKTYICKFCKKQCKDLGRLRMHYKAHMNIRSYKCRFCELTFVSTCAKTKHEKLHKDPTYKFRCPICYKRKTSEQELEEHMLVHTKKPYKCEVCHEAFARQYLKENHMANLHSELKEINSQKLKDAIKSTTVVLELGE